MINDIAVDKFSICIQPHYVLGRKFSQHQDCFKIFNSKTFINQATGMSPVQYH